MLGESDVVVDIPNDDALKPSEGMDEEATKMPHETMKKPKDASNPREGVSAKELEGGLQISPNSALPSAKDSTITSSSSLPLAGTNIYILEWGIT